MNKPFFDICDGIFVNYTWQVWLSLLFSMSKFDFNVPLPSKRNRKKKKNQTKLFCNTQENYPRRSAAVAGDRKFDVYMGIDVFGRNTYGGGQWNV